MHDLLEVSPQIIFQQLTLKPTLKLKICELVTSNSILSPSLIKSISKLCNKVEITFVCSTDFEYELLKKQNIDMFGLPGLNIFCVKYIEDLSDNYFDILFANLSSYSQILPKISQEQSLKSTRNYFIKALCKKSKSLSLYLDKSFLHSGEYVESRELLRSHHIASILDFNKLKLGTAKYEIIHLSVRTDQDANEKMRVIFTPTKEVLIQNQIDITDPALPNWVLYFNDDFKAMLEALETGIFNVDRDRQINNSMLSNIKSSNTVPVIKSKHLGFDNITLETEFNNDPFYIELGKLEKLVIKKYLNSNNVFLCPNMTPHIRIFRKPHGYLMNSSVCILTLKSSEVQINDSDLEFWRSKEFLEFYRIARNKSQLNLNIDKSAVFYFGKLKTNRNAI